ncbi:MAG: hypothetical protein Ct9H300mP25_16480 [Acidobacteriota bacterium]|nr:MAG: hypothetical protein Ct9H300mP25_16480 [Acidobacteriota bacterium]
MQIVLYDTTLRDGAQTEGVSFSTEDKLRIAQRIDDYGIHYIEGGFPGSNPKDREFFDRAAEMTWRHARITAFGATRYKHREVGERSHGGGFAVLSDADRDDCRQIFPVSGRDGSRNYD